MFPENIFIVVCKQLEQQAIAPITPSDREYLNTLQIGKLLV